MDVQLEKLDMDLGDPVCLHTRVEVIDQWVFEDDRCYNTVNIHSLNELTAVKCTHQ